jgi:hypothetical protein
MIAAIVNASGTSIRPTLAVPVKWTALASIAAATNPAIGRLRCRRCHQINMTTPMPASTDGNRTANESTPPGIHPMIATIQ